MLIQIKLIISECRGDYGYIRSKLRFFMSRQLFIWMLICLNGTEYVHAQWTKKDSVWLQNILSGKEKLHLNPETMKAIEGGFLINPNKPASNMQMAPVTPLPILKDFSEYIKEDSIRHKVALKDLPVSVFMKYEPKYTKELRFYTLLRDAIRKESPFYPRRTVIDVAKMTSRKEYVHKRNSQRSGTWQNYNNLPTPDIIKKRKVFLAGQAETASKDTVLANNIALNRDSVLNKDTIFLKDTISYIE